MAKLLVCTRLIQSKMVSDLKLYKRNKIYIILIKLFVYAIQIARQKKMTRFVGQTFVYAYS